jgi:hypothetical protein
MTTPLPPTTVRREDIGPVAGSADWLRLARIARILSWLTLAWMGIEGGVAIAAAVVAGSVALLGFGLDSGIEAMASIIVIWRFTGTRLASPSSERRAQDAALGTIEPLRPRHQCDGLALRPAPAPKGPHGEAVGHTGSPTRHIDHSGAAHALR